MARIDWSHKLGAMAQEQSPAEEQPPAGVEGSRSGVVRGAEAAEAQEPPAGVEGSRSAEDRGSEATEADERAAGSAEPSRDEAPHAAADGATAERRTICRSSSDRVIAGVAGGIGAYFGIDAVVVRIAFIVLTFLGGAGPFLYLIGWLALPAEDSRSVIAKALGGDSPHRLRSLMAVVLIGVGLLITANVSGELFKVFVNVWRIAPYLALVLIAAGVALVLWPGPVGRSKPTPARRSRSSAPPPPGPAPFAAAAAGPESTAAELAWEAAGPEFKAAAPAGTVPPRSSPVRRRGRTTFGYLTVACLLVYTGGVVVLDRLDAVEVDIGVYFAIALAITGAGLLGSAFTVGARGLILLGVALSAPLLLFIGAEVPWGSGMGEVRVSVTDADELQDEYRHGAGRMVVDLRGLEPDSAANSVDLSLSVGELDVYVPDNIETTADINVGAGSIQVRYSGPLSDRQQDLSDSRSVLDGLVTLPVGYPDESGSGIEIMTIDDYLDDYERHRGIPIAPHRRQSLSRLVPDDGHIGDETHFREMFQALRAESRGSGLHWEERDEGLGLARNVTTPPWGEPESELRLDIDIGIGSVEIVTLPAADSMEGTEP